MCFPFIMRYCFYCHSAVKCFSVGNMKHILLRSKETQENKHSFRIPFTISIRRTEECREIKEPEDVTVFPQFMRGFHRSLPYHNGPDAYQANQFASAERCILTVWRSTITSCQMT